MIHFISGKPGGGKSLYAMKLIAEELVWGSRIVITNVPILLGALNEYLQREYPALELSALLTGRPGIIQRVWVLDDEQTGHFWTWRPNGVRIPQLSKDGWQRGELPSYKGIQDSGVMYVIDEVHNFFGARQWAVTGRDVLFYLSQHRKLGDTVVCITQAIGNVDKQFRSVAQDYTFVRNLSKERYGMFRLPAVFLRKTYTSPPTDTSEPMESGTFKLNVRGLAACYDSAQGVGIHGRAADKAEKGGGFHFGWFFVGLAVLVLFLFGVLPRVVGSLFGGRGVVAARAFSPGPVSKSPLNSSLGNRSGVLMTGGLPDGGGLSMARPVLASGAGLPLVVSNVVYLTGIVHLGGNRCLIALSDGRNLEYPGDDGVQAVGRRSVVVNGETLKFCAKPVVQAVFDPRRR